MLIFDFSAVKTIDKMNVYKKNNKYILRLIYFNKYAKFAAENYKSSKK